MNHYKWLKCFIYHCGWGHAPIQYPSKGTGLAWFSCFYEVRALKLQGQRTGWQLQRTRQPHLNGHKHLKAMAGKGHFCLISKCSRLYRLDLWLKFRRLDFRIYIVLSRQEASFQDNSLLSQTVFQTYYSFFLFFQNHLSVKINLFLKSAYDQYCRLWNTEEHFENLNIFNLLHQSSFSSQKNNHVTLQQPLIIIMMSVHTEVNPGLWYRCFPVTGFLLQYRVSPYSIHSACSNGKTVLIDFANKRKGLKCLKVKINLQWQSRLSFLWSVHVHG